MEPESTRAENSEKKSEMEGEVSETQREFRSERVDGLRWTASRIAQEEQCSPQSVRRPEGCLGFF